jgi:hypothetical protein
MATLTPTQRTLLQSDRVREALGSPAADEVAGAVSGAAEADDGMTTVDLDPWRDALSGALREIGPDSGDSTVMEAADNLVKQLSA